MEMPVKFTAGALIAIILGALVLAGPAAGDNQYLSEPSLIEQSLANHPGNAAASAEVAAAQARVPQASAYPDPRVSVGVMSVPVDSWRLDREPMTQVSVGVSQELPYPGKRQLNSQRSAVGVKAAQADEIKFQQDLVYQVRAAYQDLVFLDQALAVADRNLGLLRELNKIAENSYTVGRGTEQEPLSAQMEISRMLDDQLQYRGNRSRKAVEVNRLTGSDAATAVSPTRPQTKRPPLPDHDQTAAQARERNPDLIAVRAMIEEADAAVGLARLSPYPDFMVEASYGFRQEVTINGQDLAQPDLFSAGVSIPLPIWKDRKQYQERAEMDARKRGAEANAKNLEAEVMAQLEMLYADGRQADQQIALLETRSLPQARQSLAAARIAYQTGKADFQTALAAEIALYQLELRKAELFANYMKTLAAIDRLSGRPVEEIVRGLRDEV